MDKLVGMKRLPLPQSLQPISTSQCLLVAVLEATNIHPLASSSLLKLCPFAPPKVEKRLERKVDQRSRWALPCSGHFPTIYESITVNNLPSWVTCLFLFFFSDGTLTFDMRCKILSASAIFTLLGLNRITTNLINFLGQQIVSKSARIVKLFFGGESITKLASNYFKSIQGLEESRRTEKNCPIEIFSIQKLSQQILF